jgi:error-prone DNA polymerase
MLPDDLSETLRLPDYAELHALSNFSFQRGASHAHELAVRAAELGYRAIAITDECSVAGVVRAHAAVKQLAKLGVHPAAAGCGISGEV